jgi:hypothetical protein
MGRRDSVSVRFLRCICILVKADFAHGANGEKYKLNSLQARRAMQLIIYKTHIRSDSNGLFDRKPFLPLPCHYPSFWAPLMQRVGIFKLAS